MNCELCGKRLARRSARLIDGKIMCSACMFAPAKVDRSPKGEDPEVGLHRNDESAVAESDLPSVKHPHLKEVKDVK